MKNRSIKIRKGCFETNSSSEHSLIVNKEKDYVTTEEIMEFLESYTVRKRLIWHGNDRFSLPEMRALNVQSEFDSDFCIYENWYERLSYLLAYFHRDYNVLAVLAEIVREIIPNCEGFCFIKKDVNNELGYYGEEEPIEVNGIKFYSMDGMFTKLGMIDHQSGDFIDLHYFKAMRKLEQYKNTTDKELLKEFIINNKFVVVTTSDGNGLEEVLEKFSRDSYLSYFVRKGKHDYDYYDCEFKTIKDYMNEEYSDRFDED